jgi:hypothetical protein
MLDREHINVGRQHFLPRDPRAPSAFCAVKNFSKLLNVRDLAFAFAASLAARGRRYLPFLGRGHLATTTVEIPPRGRNSPFTSAQTGLAHFTTSSSTRFTTFS